MASAVLPCGSGGSLPYGPDRNDYVRNFDMSHQLYGSPPYGRSVAGGLHQVPSSSFAPCPPGLVRAVEHLSFVPPPTNAHPCSPSVHDCAS
eukprot:5767848-Amphidinium_carterae.1